MTRILRNCCIGLIGTIFMFTACVTTSTAPQPQKPDLKLAEQYLSQGQALEAQGDLPAALEQYKLALTVDPENAVARENQTRLSEKLIQLADERYQLGMKYHSQGKYGLARKEFLTALKYNPDHPQASKMLVAREPDKTPSYIFHVVQPGESLSLIAKKYYGDYKKFPVIARFNNMEDATMVKPGQRIMIPTLEGIDMPETPIQGEQDDQTFVWHTIQPGESISKLAQVYYGDYKLFHAIARFNDMEDATRVTVGQKIKIPKLSGVPFNTPKAEESSSQASASQAATAPLVPAREPKMPETQSKENEAAVIETKTAEPDGDEQIQAYREAGIALFNRGKFEDAVFELNKAIEASPDDQPTRHYLARAYFETGKQLFNQQDFKASQEAFESSLQYDPECSQCQGYIDRSKMGPLLAHRSKGIAFFKQNKYAEAIGEFEQFLQSRPQDNEIRTYLSKSYFEQGMIDYNKSDYAEAKTKFETSLAYDRDCEKCSAYIDRSAASYKEAHYNRGIIFFGKEQLPEAIAEWQMVYDMDPKYKDVEQNLKKARSLQEKLEKIKKSSQ